MNLIKERISKIPLLLIIELLQKHAKKLNEICEKKEIKKFDFKTVHKLDEKYKKLSIQLEQLEKKEYGLIKKLEEIHNDRLQFIENNKCDRLNIQRKTIILKKELEEKQNNFPSFRCETKTPLISIQRKLQKVLELHKKAPITPIQNKTYIQSKPLAKALSFEYIISDPNLKTLRQQYDTLVYANTSLAQKISNLKRLFDDKVKKNTFFEMRKNKSDFNLMTIKKGERDEFNKLVIKSNTQIRLNTGLKSTTLKYLSIKLKNTEGIMQDQIKTIKEYRKHKESQNKVTKKECQSIVDLCEISKRKRLQHIKNEDYPFFPHEVNLSSKYKF